MAFYLTLTFAGVVWVALIPVLKAHTQTTKTSIHFFLSVLFVGLCLRGLFIGSTPIYEDDWNRYLWDGAVAMQGVNPYLYAPEEIALADGSTNEDILKLAELSKSHDNFIDRINHPSLTTIYPPLAIGIFTLSAKINQLNLDTLRVIFLLSEGLTLFLLSKALAAYNRPQIWAALYALNPLVIYTGMNTAHMDVLLVPCLLATLLLIKSRPFWAGLALSAAAAIKLWPLVLAPIFYRQWLKIPKIYIGSAILIAGISAFFLSPMFLYLGENSGTSAYAQNWQTSSFLFPLIETALSALTEHSGAAARLFVSVTIVGISLWLGFSRLLRGKFIIQEDANLPTALLYLTLVFFLLSPTGYPWYAIWFMAFLPFKPLYGAAALIASLPLYYVRFALGEAGQYSLYTHYLVPLQFGLPLLILMAEFVWTKKTVSKNQRQKNASEVYS